MPATIYDVARLAGVSIATVSRVLRRSAPVQDETRLRVEHAVDELGFVPSRLGVSLAERRHAANGVVFPDLSGPTSPRSSSATRRSPPGWAAAS
jgi:LacI family transcriptional regulator